MAENILKQVEGYTANMSLSLISQGAEALVFSSPIHPYKTTTTTTDSFNPDTDFAEYILKYRPPKPYRHPILDAQLTKHRTLSEARLLHKLTLTDVEAPHIIYVDTKRGLLWMNNVAGPCGTSVKQWIWDLESLLLTADKVELREDIMRENIVSIGRLVARLHMVDIVHGDLTTSNIIIRPRDKQIKVRDLLNKDLEPVLIDLGLGSHSALAEDKAVDIYVLERAVESTHPLNNDIYKTWLLEGYVSEYNTKGGKIGKIRVKEIMRKLEDVRMRGRKRSMVG